MFDANGNEVQHTGVWVLVDGGYLKWPVTMAASSSFTCPGYAEWRKKMESVRKDIECYFGRMKARFRILKYPIELHKKTDVDNVFFTCVTLQNMLHEYDELGEWNSGLDFGEGVEGPDGAYWGPPTRRDPEMKEADVLEEVTKVSFDGEYWDCSVDEELAGMLRPNEKEMEAFHILERQLVVHFGYLRSVGLHNRWLRS